MLQDCVSASSKQSSANISNFVYFLKIKCTSEFLEIRYSTRCINSDDNPSTGSSCSAKITSTFLESKVLLSVSCCLFIPFKNLTDVVDIEDWLRNINLHLSLFHSWIQLCLLHIIACKCMCVVE